MTLSSPQDHMSSCDAAYIGAPRVCLLWLILEVLWKFREIPCWQSLRDLFIAVGSICDMFPLWVVTEGSFIVFCLSYHVMCYTLSHVTLWHVSHFVTCDLVTCVTLADQSHKCHIPVTSHVTLCHDVTWLVTPCDPEYAENRAAPAGVELCTLWAWYSVRKHIHQLRYTSQLGQKATILSSAWYSSCCYISCIGYFYDNKDYHSISSYKNH